MSHGLSSQRRSTWSIILLLGMLLVLPLVARAQVMLELIDPTSGTNVLTAVPGGSYSWDLVVTGLSASQPLNSFSLLVTTAQLDLPGTTPFDFTISDYTSLLPTGWSHGALDDTVPYAGQNVTGTGITGMAVLGTINFTILSNFVPGTPLDFNYEDPATSTVPTTGTYAQYLEDASGNQIPYTVSGGSVDVVPEPPLFFYVLGGVLFFILARRRHLTCS